MNDITLEITAAHSARVKPDKYQATPLKHVHFPIASFLYDDRDFLERLEEIEEEIEDIDDIFYPCSQAHLLLRDINKYLEDMDRDCFKYRISEDNLDAIERSINVSYAIDRYIYHQGSDDACVELFQSYLRKERARLQLKLESMDIDINWEG